MLSHCCWSRPLGLLKSESRVPDAVVAQSGRSVARGLLRCCIESVSLLWLEPGGVTVEWVAHACAGVHVVILETRQFLRSDPNLGTWSRHNTVIVFAN